MPGLQGSPDREYPDQGYPVKHHITYRLGRVLGQKLAFCLVLKGKGKTCIKGSLRLLLRLLLTLLLRLLIWQLLSKLLRLLLRYLLRLLLQLLLKLLLWITIYYHVDSCQFFSL